MNRSFRNWYLAIGCLVTLILLSVYLVFSTSESEVSSERHRPSAQTVLGTVEELPSDLSDYENEFFIENPSVAWVDTTGTKIDQKLIPSYKEEVVGAALVQISHLLDRLEKGDTILLSVPQENQTYETLISDVKRSLGVTSYSGRVVEAEIPLSFLITVGKRGVFANFSTPHASYELWGNRHYALLMDHANIDQGVDYSKPDFYFPEEDHEFE